MNKSLWLVLLALVSESALAENPSKQAFKAAYKKYNECIEKQDNVCSIEQADIALRYGLQLFDTQGKNVAMLTHNYGLALLKSDSADKRLASYPVLKEAYQRIRHAFGANSENAVLVLLDLCGSVALQPKEEQLSQTYIEDTISISENVYGADSLAHARLLQRLAKSSMESPALSWDEYTHIVQQSHGLLVQHLGSPNMETAMSALELGKLYYARGMEHKALKTFQYSLDSFEALNLNDQNYEFNARLLIVKVLSRMGNIDEANKHWVLLNKIKTAPISNYESLPVVKSAPRYPARAANRGLTGSVTLRYTVTKSGVVTDIEVVAWTGSKLFIPPSIKAVEKFKYLPRYENGKPVETRGVENTFTFEMASD